MNVLLRLTAVVSATAFMLVEPGAAQEKTPEFVFNVKVDVRNLSPEIQKVGAYCVVARNENFGQTRLGWGSTFVDLPTSQKPKSYSGVMSVPVGLQAAKGGAGQARTYWCILQLSSGKSAGKPVKAPSDTMLLWSIGRSDRPFLAEISGRLPGR